jgi:hypothetical protein
MRKNKKTKNKKEENKLLFFIHAKCYKDLVNMVAIPCNFNDIRGLNRIIQRNFASILEISTLKKNQSAHRGGRFMVWTVHRFPACPNWTVL